MSSRTVPGLPRVVRRMVAPPAHSVLRAVAGAGTRAWRPYSHLFVLGEGTGWSVDEDSADLVTAASRIGHDVGAARWARYCRRQCAFVMSHFGALQPLWLDSSHRLATAYYHGRPGTAAFPEFDDAFETLRRRPLRLERVRVTHGEMHELMVSAGVPEERVFRIPLGIDVERFALADPESRAQVRSELGVPSSAFVIGSFQKDGIGWGEGLTPKLIKGPDTLVSVVGRLHELLPQIFVLLTGPARGYVRRELTRRGIAHRHVLARSRDEVARTYHALDLCLVTSRQEGGPKAVFEALATGIPVVSTRVGQVTELLEHRRTGYLADVDDVEALVHWCRAVHDEPAAAEALCPAGRRLAEDHALERLDERWAALLEGFIEP